MKNKKEMLRIIKAAENEVLLDVTGKKNGRGAYICRDSECLKKAMSTKGLERSLKTAISAEVYEAMRKELDTLESE